MIDQAPEAATVHRGRLGQRHLVPEPLPVRVKDRRRWHAMLNYVNCGMLYDFRLCDLERFGACSSCQHGKHGAQCDESGHQRPPSNSTRAQPSMGDESAMRSDASHSYADRAGNRLGLSQ